MQNGRIAEVKGGPRDVNKAHLQPRAPFGAANRQGAACAAADLTDTEPFLFHLPLDFRKLGALLLGWKLSGHQSCDGYD